ncbi:uncharacterized protein LOC141525793 isoform X2 [Cotesia typhae]
MSTCDETSVQNVIDSKKNSKRSRKKPSRFQDSCTSSSSDDTDKNNEDDEGLGLDNLETKVLPSFHYDGSDNGNIKHTEADVDDLLETQELNYGDFFEDHPTYSDRALTKKLAIRSVERVQIPGIEAKKITSMGKDVQVTKHPYQPNKSGKTESSNDSKNPLAASSAVVSNNNSNLINEVNHDSVAASSTGRKKVQQIKLTLLLNSQ